MNILAYKGTTLPSRLIRLQTRSPYSHVAVQLDDGTIIEAWAIGGVRHVSGPMEDHKAGTEYETYAIVGDYDQDDVLKFLNSQLGKKYDWRSIIRFLTRRNQPADDRWFCSELVFEAFKRGGLMLLERIRPSHVTPRDIVISPHIKGPMPRQL